MTARSPTDIDKHVGARLRLRRSQLNMSQSELGKELGVTFQQVQKYERGTNRIGASRLYSLAAVLEVDIQYFFDGLDTPLTNNAERSEELYNFIASADGLDLANAFSDIKSAVQRRRLIDLVRSMGEDQPLSDEDIKEAQAGYLRAAA